MRVALIIGITGQDGSYLAELLLRKGYRVHGSVRRSSSFNTGRIDHLYRDAHEPDAPLHLHYADLCDGMSLQRLISRTEPDEIYNLGAQSHVRVSFDQPEFTAQVNALGALRVLECVRDLNPRIRVYQAATSELFGNTTHGAIDENTPFDPRSPYAAAKVFALYTTRNYREAYRLFAANGILFNHESPRRGETFVSRKITRAVGRIRLGLQQHLYLGNLEARRDWGFAGDYVEAMHAMLQQPAAEDFVIGTGQAHSVREFCEAAFGHAGLDYRDFVRIDPRYLRPTEVDHLLADPRKARERLGWRPRVTFGELVRLMVEHDLELAERERRAGCAVRDDGTRLTREATAEPIAR
jgi:GDPmannose 4,6-dehydratase